MSHVAHEYPRAYEAATKVDPLVLAMALEHIARTAARSRSQTRRVRWIERRATTALRGDECRDIDVDLPKNPGPDTHEKLQRRMGYHIAIKHSLAEALRELLRVCLAMDLENQAARPTEDEYRAAVHAAEEALASHAEEKTQ